jgi:pSer/pThr/pTyr-binding forkhead associated (FHA) protein
MNGTWVNGVRVIGEAAVRAGDAVRFGQSGFRLSAR